MKKRLLVVAALSLVSTASFAQSNATIYGVVDVAVAHLKGGTLNDDTFRMLSGVKNGSRIGFRGTEELGGGLKANFVLENGFNVDNGTMGQGGRLFGRRATVGLSGDFGRIDLGRRNSPFFNAIDTFDPMETGYAGSAANLINPYNVRMSNSVIYTGPNVGGFVGEIAYGFGEQTSFGANREVGGSLTYTNGPIGVALAHHNANDVASNDRKSTALIGKYDFSVAAVHLGYVKGSGTETVTTSPTVAYRRGAEVDESDVLVGISVPFGASAVLASYIRKDDKTASNLDARQAAVAYRYSLSKRTNLYTSYARISNKNGAAYATEAGEATREFNVGLQHLF